MAYVKDNQFDDIKFSVENFIAQATQVFIDLDLDSEKGASKLFMVLLSDIEQYGGSPLEKISESINSLKQLESFVKDIWSKFKESGELYGLKYKILRPNDFGYYTAYNCLQPLTNHTLETKGTKSTPDMLSFKRPIVLVNDKILVEVE